MICASSKVVKEYTRRTDYIFQYTCQLIFHLTIHVGPTLPALNSHHSHKTRQIRPHWKCLIYNILVGEKNKLPKPQKRCLETCNTWLLSSSGVNVRPFAVSTILFERQTLSICWMYCSMMYVAAYSESDFWGCMYDTEDTYVLKLVSNNVTNNITLLLRVYFKSPYVMFINETLQHFESLQL